MKRRSVFVGIFGIVALVAAHPSLAFEEALTPYASGGLGAPFSMTQIDPFEPKQRWGSEPRITYQEILRRTAFIYEYYRRVLGFSQREIRQLIKMDLRADPGSVAYVSSRLPGTDDYRGVLRIASTRDLRGFFAPVAIHPNTSLLPMQQKYARLGLDRYVTEHYPCRVELGRFASTDEARGARLDRLTRLLRATTLFLTEAFRDGTILIESTAVTREIYEQFGFTVDAAAPMPKDRFLMTVTRRALAELLVGVVERSRYLPGEGDLYSVEGAEIALRQLDDAETRMPRLFRRYLGSVPYYRVLTLASAGRAAEALPLLERLHAQYGNEPELVSLDLYARTLADVDVWTGEGDAERARLRLTREGTLGQYRRYAYDRYSSWNDLLYWQAMTTAFAGRLDDAVAIRNALVLDHYSELGAGLRSLDMLGWTQRKTVEEASADPVQRLSHARFLYQATPLGVSPTYNRFCGGLLARTGNGGLAAAMHARATLWERKE